MAPLIVLNVPQWLCLLLVDSLGVPEQALGCLPLGLGFRMVEDAGALIILNLNIVNYHRPSEFK